MEGSNPTEDHSPMANPMALQGMVLHLEATPPTGDPRPSSMGTQAMQCWEALQEALLWEASEATWQAIIMDRVMAMG